MDDTIIACVATPIDRRAILDGAGAARVQFCPGLHELHAAVAANDNHSIVVEILSEVGAEMRHLLHAIASQRRINPIVLRFATVRGLGEYFGNSQWAGELSISLAGFDDLECDVVDLRSLTRSISARTAIITSLAPVVPPSVLEIVLACMIMGERRTSVSEVSARCDRSERRVAEVLARAQVPGAKQLLMWSLALHTQWRVKQLGWPAKRAAMEAGFSSSEMLSRRIERAIGSRLAEQCRHESFESALARLVGIFRRVSRIAPAINASIVERDFR